MTQQINLYAPELRRRQEVLTANNLTVVSVLLLVLVVVAGIWTRGSAGKAEAELASLAPQVKALKDQLPVLGQRLSAYQPDAKLLQELNAVKAQVAGHAGVLDLLQKGLGPNAVSFAEYLRGFARQTPNGLWLTGFDVQGDGAGMQIQGRTVNPALIAEYIHRLGGEKAFQGRAFSALSLGQPGFAVGSSVGANAKTQATPPYHEFTLTPDQQGAGIAVPSAKESAASATTKNPIDDIPPAEAAQALSQASKSGGTQR